MFGRWIKAPSSKTLFLNFSNLDVDGFSWESFDMWVGMAVPSNEVNLFTPYKFDNDIS